MDFERRCWAEVDLDALRHNYRLIKQAVPHTDIMAVVKADAYGHGDVAVAALLDEEGAAGFAVSGFAEALRLRRAGLKKPILILGYTDVQNAAALCAHRITQTVFSLDYARALSSAAQRANAVVDVHIKIDSGMGRIGVCARSDDAIASAVEQADAICRLPGLNATGIFTHFAVADGTSAHDVSYTKEQYRLFNEVVRRLRQRGHNALCAHCCNSAGVVAWSTFRMDMVRPGIILYGHNPSGEVGMPGLQPVMRLKAVVSMVKEALPGDSISYGCTFTAQRPTRLATLAVGYADGYPRKLSNTGVVSLHGCPAPVVGRVCMDQMMVDVTDIPNVQAGDVAVLFGDSAAHNVEEIAEAAGTVNYEVLCDIGRRVPRVYIENGREIDLVNYLEGK
jgi:alanine racemase